MRIGIVINTSLYERVSYALNLATMYVIRGNEVYILFGYDGVKRLTKNNIDNIDVDVGRHIAEDIRKGLEKEIIPRLSEQILEFRRIGGKVYACSSAMALHNIVLNDLIDIDGVTGLYEFIEKMGEDATIIYV